MRHLTWRMGRNEQTIEKTLNNQLQQKKIGNKVHETKTKIKIT